MQYYVDIKQYALQSSDGARWSLLRNDRAKQQSKSNQQCLTFDGKSERIYKFDKFLVFISLVIDSNTSVKFEYIASIYEGKYCLTDLIYYGKFYFTDRIIERMEMSSIITMQTEVVFKGVVQLIQIVSNY